MDTLREQQIEKLTYRRLAVLVSKIADLISGPDCVDEDEIAELLEAEGIDCTPTAYDGTKHPRKERES